MAGRGQQVDGPLTPAFKLILADTRRVMDLGQLQHAGGHTTKVGDANPVNRSDVHIDRLG
ncbi:hypothetical protein D3C75_1156370 [compost metagenome]